MDEDKNKNSNSVASNSEKEETTVPQAVDELKSIENLINLNIAKMDRAKEEIKPLREMITSLLESDLDYAELSEKATAANKEKTAKKKNIMQTQNGKELTEKLRALQEELADSRDALSTYLREYQQKTGLNEFEGEDGELRQIVFVARLVRKTNLNRE